MMFDFQVCLLLMSNKDVVGKETKEGVELSHLKFSNITHICFTGEKNNISGPYVL